MDYAEQRFSQKTIYIHDFGSTHGTWLNNVKLITGEDTPLLSGDILRFGVDVDRGDGAS
jgi:pSer/pThr/pTyr-binding forkhead associated (FHA) protein